MHHRDYPDLTIKGRTWNVFGSRHGEATVEFFRPDETHARGNGPRRRSWVWVDELLDPLPGGEAPDILTDAHSPHEYSGYELHVRKQPVITTFATHDHLIIPDLDVDMEGDQTVSIILHTDFIWTRRSQAIPGLDRFLSHEELRDRGPEHETAVYAFIGILRVLLESLDRTLMLRERQTYDLEDYFLDRERGTSAYHSSFDDTGTRIPHPLAEFKEMAPERMLVEIKIFLAWLRKQYDAFDRVASELYDPAHGAFRRHDRPELEEEAYPYFQHLSDQIRRALTKIEHLRDIHNTLDQLISSEQAERTNRTLLRLTWLSIFFLPFGAIAGFFGMNISYLQNQGFGLDSAIAVGSFAISFLLASWFYIVQTRAARRSVGRGHSLGGR